MNQLVGQRIRMMRAARGWSQSELAQRLSDRLGKPFDPTMLSRLERGTRPILLSEVVVISELMDVSLLRVLEDTLGLSKRMMLDGIRPRVLSEEGAELLEQFNNVNHRQGVLRKQEAATIENLGVLVADVAMAVEEATEAASSARVRTDKLREATRLLDSIAEERALLITKSHDITVREIALRKEAEGDD